MEGTLGVFTGEVNNVCDYVTYSRGRRRGRICRWGPLRNHQSTWQQSEREREREDSVFGMSQRDNGCCYSWYGGELESEERGGRKEGEEGEGERREEGEGERGGRRKGKGKEGEEGEGERGGGRRERREGRKGFVKTFSEGTRM